MALQQSDFDFVQKLVQQKAAIVLDNGKQYFVESRLTPLAQNTGHDTIEKLIQALKQTRITVDLLNRWLRQSPSTKPASFETSTHSNV